MNADFNVPRSGLWESIGFDRVTNALRRLERLRKPGRYIFEVNTATHPFPLAPKKIELKRNDLHQSTKNGIQQGSLYNNLSLSTIFDKDERNHTPYKTLIESLNISDREFISKASRFMSHFSIEGDPADILSWSKYTRIAFHARLNSYEEIPSLKGLFAAAVKKDTYFIDKNEGIVSLVELPVTSHDEIKKSLDKIFVAMTLSKYDDRGIMVPSLMRAFFIYTWLAGAIFFITFGSIRGISSIEIWSKDYFESIIFVAISVPALITYITDEPNVIKSALRANRILVSNSEVKKYFKLEKFDYAVMALINTEMWLVSNQTATYLQRGGHKALKGDICVTDREALQRVGFYVSTSMARREWDDTNIRVANNSDGSVSILTDGSKVSFAIPHDYNKMVR